MNELQVRQIIRQLENIQARPSMYLAGPEILAAARFIYGFNTACGVFGLHGGEFNQDNIYQEVLAEHGLRYSARPIWFQMEDQGLDESTIINELFTIEIEVWKRRYNITSI